MKFLWLFTKDCWSYLLEKRSDNEVPWLKVIWCRWNGHPAGIVYYNPSGLEPDYTCRCCGDDLN